MLFLSYIDELQGTFSKSIIYHFADDTNLLIPPKTFVIIESLVNHELKLLSQWLRSHKSLNESKYELIIFRAARKNWLREPDIRINNYKWKLHSHVKYLGVLIDEVLYWNKQFESIFMKLARGNSILSKLGYFVPKDIYILVYIHLIYGCLIWFYCKESNIDRLIKLQKRCIRIIFFFFLTMIPILIFNNLD